uniref:Uncharacterized protein n=1 Tax=Dicentrarchus labrax TaxID=13489 RepID=A0A8C4GVT1_DICLA
MKISEKQLPHMLFIFSGWVSSVAINNLHKWEINRLNGAYACSKKAIDKNMKSCLGCFACALKMVPNFITSFFTFKMLIILHC